MLPETHTRAHHSITNEDYGPRVCNVTLGLAQDACVAEPQLVTGRKSV